LKRTGRQFCDEQLLFAQVLKRLFIAGSAKIRAPISDPARQLEKPGIALMRPDFASDQY
jgi:hypothetical protein